MSTTFHAMLASQQPGIGKAKVGKSEKEKAEEKKDGVTLYVSLFLDAKYLFKINHLILGREFAIELMSDAVEDVPDGGLFGGCFRVLGRFQAVAEAPPFGPMLFKKRFSVRGEKSLANS